MQVVILAAGRGTRMGALTEKTPKPMLKVAGKTLLEHKFDALPADVDEIIIVVGYLREVITEYYGDSYQGKKIRYVEQQSIVGGTADALWQAKECIRDRFVVMMGDDIYAAEDIAKIHVCEWALAVGSIGVGHVGGRVIMDAHNHILEVVEGAAGGSGLFGTNLFVLDKRIFTFPQVTKSPDSSELGLPQTVLAASRASGILLEAVQATGWIQITSPDDIQKAEAQLRTW